VTRDGGVVRVDIDTRADALNDGRLGKTTPASNRCISHWRFPNPLGQCHCGQPSLTIAVNSHIDDVGNSLNDGITSRRSESGIPFVSQLMTWSKGTWSVRECMNRNLCPATKPQWAACSFST
jgi:hypothetical protein